MWLVSFAILCVVCGVLCTETSAHVAPRSEARSNIRRPTGLVSAWNQTANLTGLDLLEDILKALELAVAFYANNYLGINLDGVFGLRLLEGQLIYIRDELRQRSQKNTPYDDQLLISLSSRLDKLQTLARNISEASLESVERHDEKYYRRMSSMVLRPWSYAKPFIRSIDASLRHKTKRNMDGQSSTCAAGPSMSEETSDRCMGELLGGGPDHRAPCSLSSECVTIMSNPGQTDYIITHQLLYTMIAHQYNCTAELSRQLFSLNRSGDVDSLQAEFCADNFYEVSETVRRQRGIILPRLQDLFFEQEFVCPLAGYVEFLHADWLHQMISWQRANGCRGQMVRSKLARIIPDDNYEYAPNPGPTRNNHSPLRTMDSSVDSRKNAVYVAPSQHVPDAGSVNSRSKTAIESKQSLLQFRRREKGPLGRSRNGVHVTGRKLLYERVLQDGCLSHKTAVAVGALTQYLRFVLLFSPSPREAVTHLQGVNYLMHPAALDNQPAPMTQAKTHLNPSSLLEPGLKTNKLAVSSQIGAKADDDSERALLGYKYSTNMTLASKAWQSGNEFVKNISEKIDQSLVSGGVISSQASSSRVLNLTADRSLPARFQKIRFENLPLLRHFNASGKMLGKVEEYKTAENRDNNLIEDKDGGDVRGSLRHHVKNEAVDANLSNDEKSEINDDQVGGGVQIDEEYDLDEERVDDDEETEDDQEDNEEDENFEEDYGEEKNDEFNLENGGDNVKDEFVYENDIGPVHKDEMSRKHAAHKDYDHVGVKRDRFGREGDSLFVATKTVFQYHNDEIVIKSRQGIMAHLANGDHVENVTDVAYSIAQTYALIIGVMLLVLFVLYKFMHRRKLRSLHRRRNNA